VNFEVDGGRLPRGTFSVSLWGGGSGHDSEPWLLPLQQQMSTFEIHGTGARVTERCPGNRQPSTVNFEFTVKALENINGAFRLRSCFLRTAATVKVGF
jgi:hypothetical protein